MNKGKTHIYLVPGLGASPLIFDYIKINPDRYKLHFLEWLVPRTKNESIQSYAERMSDKVKHSDTILIGVSFGGVMVQEMKHYVKQHKTIIISSIKNRYEMPSRMRFSKKTNAHKILPTKAFSNIDKYEKYVFGEVLKLRFEMYKKYLSMRDDLYLPWAIHTIVNWQREITDPDVLHIHGTKDYIFPVKNITNYVPVEGGSHIMILDRARKINAILQELL